MQSILAVDDSASMRKMVSFTLTGAGYHVVEAVDGVDAFEQQHVEIHGADTYRAASLTQARTRSVQVAR